MVAVLVVAKSKAGDKGQTRLDAETALPDRKRDETPFGPPFDLYYNTRSNREEFI